MSPLPHTRLADPSLLNPTLSCCQPVPAPPPLLSMLTSGSSPCSPAPSFHSTRPVSSTYKHAGLSSILNKMKQCTVPLAFPQTFLSSRHSGFASVTVSNNSHQGHQGPSNCQTCGQVSAVPLLGLPVAFDRAMAPPEVPFPLAFSTPPLLTHHIPLPLSGLLSHCTPCTCHRRLRCLTGSSHSTCLKHGSCLPAGTAPSSIIAISANGNPIL